MAETALDLRDVPCKGPALTPFSASILALHREERDRLPIGSANRELVQNCIDFILRRNCRCPDDSKYCMCGGGYGGHNVPTAM